jgi:Dolichyl-phosphate-mannose-protein mannosyltransferase
VASRTLRLLGLFLVVSVLTRMAFLSIPILDVDEAAHIVGAWELLEGGRLYTDFADNKPPLLYVYYALSQAVLGRGMLAVRVLTTAVVLPLTALALSAFFGHDRRGVAAGILYLVYGASFYAHDMQAVNAEIPMLLPGAWALVRLRRESSGTRDAIVAGFLFGTAFLFKYQIVFWLAAAPLALTWVGERRRAARCAAALAAGFALPLLGAWAAFEATGGAADLLYWTLRSNVTYLDSAVPADEALRRAGRGLLPFLAATAPLWWGWRRSAAMFATRYESRLVTALVLVSVPPAFLGFRFYPHYFIQLYVPLALGAAPWVSRAFTTPLSGGARRFAAATLFLFGGFTAAGLYLHRFRTDVYEETSPRLAEAAAWLRSDRCSSTPTLFVWGYAPTLYYLTGLRPASRFVMPQTSLTGYIAGNTASATGGVDATRLVKAEHWDLLLRELEGRPATYIVDTAPSGIHRWNRFPLRNFPRLARLVAEGYEPVATVHGLVIYRRRECRGPGT